LKYGLSSILTKKEFHLTPDPYQNEHIGWDLWRASQIWKKEFVAGMVGKGHGWFAEARGNIVHMISREGTKQSAVVASSHLTKQAVQQFVDELEADGIVVRAPDPTDGRGKLVRLTAKGQRAMVDAQIVKKQIEASYEHRIGKDGLILLRSLLDKLTIIGH
jgi:DNA-binding MarR family transcriptional regulator